MAAAQQEKIDSGFAAKSEPATVLDGIDLSGKVAVVTGGYSGIGLETTRALVGAGARVHVPVRDAQKAAESLADLPSVLTAPMNLADLASVLRYCEDLRAKEKRIDLLINNAGIMACPEARVGDGWESQFGVNHIGHFVLTRELLPTLLAAEAPRVISLSSLAHRRSDILWDDVNFASTPYDKWTAYAQAKTANALFAVALHQRYFDDNLRAFSVHPGGIMTPLQRHLDNEEMQALGWTDEEGNLSERVAALFKTPAQGCATTLWAATSARLADRGGLYCEDCDVADLVTEDSPGWKDVAPWAVDEAGAERLWSLTERMLHDGGY